MAYGYFYSYVLGNFILYMGNVEKTHNQMPGTSTDDYMAAEVDSEGYVKLSIDLGAGKTEIVSNAPITYGQWHQLEIDRYLTQTFGSNFTAKFR